MKITRTTLEWMLKRIQDESQASRRIQMLRIDYLPGYGYRLSELRQNGAMRPYTQCMTGRELFWYLSGFENGLTLMMQ